MSKQNIRSQEIKNNFILKASQIIENEGTANLTVRKLSKETGYHYAAIYHYFKNIEHLIAHVSAKFHEDLYKMVESNSKNFSEPIDVYINGMVGMAKYGLKKPKAFLCIFVDSFGSINRSEVVEVVANSNLLVNKKILLDKILSYYKISKQKMNEYDKSAMSLVIGYVILNNSLRIEGPIENILKSLAASLKNLWIGTIKNK